MINKKETCGNLERSYRGPESGWAQRNVIQYFNQDNQESRLYLKPVPTKYIYFFVNSNSNHFGDTEQG